MFCDVLCKQDSKVSQRLIFSWFLIRWLLVIQILIFLLVLSVTEHFREQLHFTSHVFKYFLTLILVVRKPTRPTVVLKFTNTIKQGNRHTLLRSINTITKLTNILRRSNAINKLTRTDEKTIQVRSYNQ